MSYFTSFWNSVPDIGRWVLIWTLITPVTFLTSFVLCGRLSTKAYGEAAVGHAGVLASIRLVGLAIFSEELQDVLQMDILFFALGSSAGAIFSSFSIISLFAERREVFRRVRRI